MWPGGKALRTSAIRVTTTPRRVSYARLPAPNTLVNGGALTVSVAALLVDGAPVAGVKITCGIEMSKKTKADLFWAQAQSSQVPYTGCYAAAGQCGHVAPLSASQITGRNGEATLHLQVLPSGKHPHVVML